MQPETLNQYTRVRNKGYDLMLAVDLSPSMQSLDLSRSGRVFNLSGQATRLDVVKDVVGKFIAGRQGDRVGLVLFGAKAYQHVPLTFDLESVVKMLDNTVVGEAGDSTAIGDAIGMAVSNLRDRPEHSRVIILLTDGGDNSSTLPPMQAAKLAAQYGIRIYTIGVGNNPGEVDEELLKGIAGATEGKYFRATDKAALENIYNEINMLEKTEAETRSYMIHNPLYQVPLGIAMALLLLFAMMPVYRRAYHGT
jgi:Ca-activated chloride channel family protein